MFRQLSRRDHRSRAGHVDPCVQGNFAELPVPAVQSGGSVIQAAWSFMLAARNRGIGTVWTRCPRLEGEIAELLGIPSRRFRRWRSSRSAIRSAPTSASQTRTPRPRPPLGQLVTHHPQPRAGSQSRICTRLTARTRGERERPRQSSLSPTFSRRLRRIVNLVTDHAQDEGIVLQQGVLEAVSSTASHTSTPTMPPTSGTR